MDKSRLREWFISVAVVNLLFTGADGYRCDCEPNYAGYAVWEEVRRRCLEAGRKVLIMAEDGAERRFSFDMEQDGVLWVADRDRGGQYVDPVNFYLEKLDNWFVWSSVEKRTNRYRYCTHAGNR